MMKPRPSSPVDLEAPLTTFLDCHHGILSNLGRFGKLVTLLEPAAEARAIARDTLAFFRTAVYEHHIDEERELFPAVLASARKGDEHCQVEALVQRLTAQHREIESAWEALEPEIRKLAKGRDSQVDPAAIEDLVAKYEMHARFEENEFLPLAETILGRNSRDMGALDLSLHIRHRMPRGGHI